MTKTFDIIFEQQKRTFKDWFSDFEQTSLIYGLITFIIVIILFIPAIIIFLIFTFFQFIFNRIMRKPDNPIVFPDRKELEIDFENFKIKAFEIYDKKYYSKLKERYNKTDNELSEIDDVCFIETIPNIDALSEKLFTYTMIDFAGGIILQEVEFKKWTSKIIFLDLTTQKIDLIKELEHVYELSFDKNEEQELNIILRYPGKKQKLTLRKK